MIGSKSLSYARKEGLETPLFYPEVLVRTSFGYASTEANSNGKSFFMKNYLLVFLALVVTSFTSPTAWAQTEKPLVKPVALSFLRVGSATNVVSSYSAGPESDTLMAGWTSGESQVRLIAHYSGGSTNLGAFQLSEIGKERNFEWTPGQEFPPIDLPDGTERFLLSFIGKIRNQYHSIGGGMVVEVAPMKFVAKAEKLWDGEVFADYLFVDESGKYRVVDGNKWAGEAPTVDQPVFLGSDEENYFAAEKKGEKFLLSTEVFSVLKTRADYRRASAVRMEQRERK